VLSKRTIIVALVGLNLFLLGALILSSYAPPAAYAQVRGRPGDFVMATTQIHKDIDALTVIHTPTGAMHVFVPQESKNGASLQYVMTRDLNRDFNRR
jgi:hypothetical protein